MTVPVAETVKLPSTAIVCGSGDKLNPPMLPDPTLDGAAAEWEPNTTNAPFCPPVLDATLGTGTGVAVGVAVDVGTAVEIAVGMGRTVAVTGAAVGRSLAGVDVSTSVLVVAAGSRSDTSWLQASEIAAAMDSRRYNRFNFFTSSPILQSDNGKAVQVGLLREDTGRPNCKSIFAYRC